MFPCVLKKDQYMKNRETRIYNIILPFWLLVWFPSWLWLILIPFNYLIDLLVTTLAMKKLGIEDYRKKALERSGMICLIGFISDFIGAAFLLLAYFVIGQSKSDFAYDIIYGLGWSLYNNIFALIIVLIGIAIAGACIYFLNAWLLRRDSELSIEQVKKIALYLAIFTAPYTFLIPTSLFY